MSLYPECPHGHGDLNIPCPRCESDEKLLRIAEDISGVKELRAERDSLRAQLATISAERDALTELSVATMHIAEEPRDLWESATVTCPTIEAVKALRNARDELYDKLVALTAAAVVKDEALRAMLRCSTNSERVEASIQARAALSPAENPLLADLRRWLWRCRKSTKASNG